MLLMQRPLPQHPLLPTIFLFHCGRCCCQLVLLQQ
jgi:hypothetical protein